MQYILVQGGDTSSGERTIAVDRRALVPAGVTPTPTQHRRHRRVRADDVLVKLRLGDGLLVVKVEDISMGGLFARTHRDVPWGAFVELGLLRAGHDELRLAGIVVSDARRGGLALRFEGVDAVTLATLRRLVLEQQVRPAADDIERAPPDDPAVAGRDRELDELRRRVAMLHAENERLRVEVGDGHAAQRLVGRLQVELERMKARVDGDVVVGSDVLADVHRDVETAWVAIARVADAMTKLR
jgi:hypothetical protein